MVSTILGCGFNSSPRATQQRMCCLPLEKSIAIIKGETPGFGYQIPTGEDARFCLCRKEGVSHCMVRKKDFANGQQACRSEVDSTSMRGGSTVQRGRLGRLTSWEEVQSVLGIVLPTTDFSNRLMSVLHRFTRRDRVRCCSAF